jgi:hypothetical protein
MRLNQITKGVVKVIAIDHNQIKAPTWIVFKRNDDIYKATPTDTKGEFHIEHITEPSEWRYVQPDSPGREEYDKFQKVIIEYSEEGETLTVDLAWSEWQVALNLLVGKKVEFDFESTILGKEYTGTITKILEL